MQSADCGGHSKRFQNAADSALCMLGVLDVDLLHAMMGLSVEEHGLECGLECRGP